MPIPTEPTKVSAENLYQDSDHPDVAVFQAAMVRNLLADISITGEFDSHTQQYVAEVAAFASFYGVQLTDVGTVCSANDNFIRLAGLGVR